MSKHPYTIVLYYRRQPATVEQLNALADEAAKKAAVAAKSGGKMPDINITGGAARVLLPGEEKDPWPSWLRTIYERRGFTFDFFNFTATKGNLSQAALEREATWMARLVKIARAPSVIDRFFLALLVDWRSWRKLCRIDDAMRHQLSRVDCSTIEGYMDGFVPALDTIPPWQNPQGTPPI